MNYAWLLGFALLQLIGGLDVVQSSLDVRPKGKFEARIVAIDTALTEEEKGTLFGFDLLSYIPGFKSLASQAEDYVDDDLKYLAEPSHDWRPRRIALYAMHELPMNA